MGEVVGAQADSCGAVGGLIKNTETWSFGFWTEDSSAVGFNNIGSASITDFEACANAEAAVNAINGAGGNFKIDGGRVVIGD